MKKHISILSAFLILGIVGHSQKLPSFGADMGKKSIGPKEVRIPYTDMISYYGFISPGVEPDEVKDGKNFFFVYMWVPAAAPELGVRMVSPVPSGMVAGEGDFASEEYTKNASDTKSYFDTWITLERAQGVTGKEDILTKGKTANWTRLEYNDDSGELPAQPSGSKYNSVMRITSSVSDPLKSLTMGLYRIGFTTYKTGEVKGGFVAQVGSPVKLPGVVIAKTAEELAAALNGK